ncbi:hypothetical protein EON68_00780, partial [archaeon]
MPRGFSAYKEAVSRVYHYYLPVSALRGVGSASSSDSAAGRGDAATHTTAHPSLRPLDRFPTRGIASRNSSSSSSSDSDTPDAARAAGGLVDGAWGTAGDALVLSTLQSIMSEFVGTHSFHNFTAQSVRSAGVSLRKTSGARTPGSGAPSSAHDNSAAPNVSQLYEPVGKDGEAPPPPPPLSPPRCAVSTPDRKSVPTPRIVDDEEGDASVWGVGHLAGAARRDGVTATFLQLRAAAGERPLSDWVVSDSFRRTVYAVTVSRPIGVAYDAATQQWQASESLLPPPSEPPLRFGDLWSPASLAPFREARSAATNCTPRDDAQPRAWTDSVVRISIHGSGFLYHQIRFMVGVAVAIARGDLPRDVLTAALHLPAVPRLPLAPAGGLVQGEVSFNSDCGVSLFSNNALDEDALLPLPSVGAAHRQRDFDSHTHADAISAATQASNVWLIPRTPDVLREQQDFFLRNVWPRVAAFCGVRGQPDVKAAADAPALPNTVLATTLSAARVEWDARVHAEASGSSPPLAAAAAAEAATGRKAIAPTSLACPGPAHPISLLAPSAHEWLERGLAEQCPPALALQGMLTWWQAAAPAVVAAAATRAEAMLARQARVAASLWQRDDKPVPTLTKPVYLDTEAPVVYTSTLCEDAEADLTPRASHAARAVTVSGLPVDTFSASELCSIYGPAAAQAALAQEADASSTWVRQPSRSDMAEGGGGGDAVRAATSGSEHAPLAAGFLPGRATSARLAEVRTLLLPNGIATAVMII